MQIKYKYECPACDLDVYFEVDFKNKKLCCPECKAPTLRIAGFKREGNLALFELTEKVQALEERVKKLDYILNESEMDKFLVT